MSDWDCEYCGGLPCSDPLQHARDRANYLAEALSNVADNERRCLAAVHDDLAQALLAHDPRPVILQIRDAIRAHLDAVNGPDQN